MSRTAQGGGNGPLLSGTYPDNTILDNELYPLSQLSRPHTAGLHLGQIRSGHSPIAQRLCRQIC